MGGLEGLGGFSRGSSVNGGELATGCDCWALLTLVECLRSDDFCGPELTELKSPISAFPSNVLSIDRF